MKFVADGNAIEIENETGARYRVDLCTRTVIQVSGPPPGGAPPETPPTPKPGPS